MNQHDEPARATLQRIIAVCERFDAAWRSEQQPRIEEFLNEVSDSERRALLRELVAHELRNRFERGEHPLQEPYIARFPEHVELVNAAFHSYAGELNDLSRTSAFDPARAGLQSKHCEGLIPGAPACSESSSQSSSESSVVFDIDSSRSQEEDETDKDRVES